MLATGGCSPSIVADPVERFGEEVRGGTPGIRTETNVRLPAAGAERDANGDLECRTKPLFICRFSDRRIAASTGTTVSGQPLWLPVGLPACHPGGNCARLFPHAVNDHSRKFQPIMTYSRLELVNGPVAPFDSAVEE